MVAFWSVICKSARAVVYGDWRRRVVAALGGVGSEAAAVLSGSTVSEAHTQCIDEATAEDGQRISEVSMEELANVVQQMPG